MIPPLRDLLRYVVECDVDRERRPFEAATETALELFETADTVFFLGNGGTAATASHLVTDAVTRAGRRAMAFSDPALLTCLTNDLGHEIAYATLVQRYAAAGDLVIAMSSSGQSANILTAAARARDVGCHVITMSGFDPENPLRRSRLGRLNVYVPSRDYGTVELVHLAVGHTWLDARVAAPG